MPAFLAAWAGLGRDRHRPARERAATGRPGGKAGPASGRAWSFVSGRNCMDSALSAAWLADAQAIVLEIGQTVTINGTEYLAAVGEPMLTQSFAAGGLSDTISVTIKVPATSAAIAAKAHMQIGKTLTFDGRSLRVVGFSHKPGTAWLQLTTQDADQFR